MQAKSVIKNGSLYVFGNIFNKAIAFITVPIFTRILTTEEYGIVNTYSSWINLVAVIMGLSLGNSIRNAFVDMKEELGQYISSIFTLACVNLGILCTIFIFISNHISLPKELIWFCLIESFSNFIVNAVVHRYIMEEKAVKRTCLLVFPNLLGAALSIALITIMNEKRHYGRIIATCAITSLFGISIMLFYMVRYKTFFNKKYWKYALPISIPLVFHGISCNVLGTSDRSIITYYKGAAETGIYSLVYNLSSVVGVITSSAESMWVPHFYTAMKKEQYKLVNFQTSIYIYAILFFYCGLLAFAPELLLLMGGKEYMSGANLIFPIVAALFLTVLYGVYAGIESFMKNTKVMAISTMTAAIINIILNLIFVPSFGKAAAAYTTLASYAVSLLLHSMQSHKMAPSVFPCKMWVLPLLIIFIAGIITNYTMNMIVIRYIVMILLGMIYLAIFYVFIKRKGEFLRVK